MTRGVREKGGAYLFTVNHNNRILQIRVSECKRALVISGFSSFNVRQSQSSENANFVMLRRGLLVVHFLRFLLGVPSTDGVIQIVEHVAASIAKYAKFSHVIGELREFDTCFRLEIQASMRNRLGFGDSLVVCQRYSHREEETSSLLQI